MDGCGYSATVHEIGHIVGLGHEFERPDVRRYLHPTAIDGVRLCEERGTGVRLHYDAYDSDGESWNLPFAFASVMNYRDTGYCFDSVPGGVAIGEAPDLTSGIIDRVAHLYGAAPLIRIETSPAGGVLSIRRKDGSEEPFETSGAVFGRDEWEEGSEYIVEVKDKGRFLRWNDLHWGSRRIVRVPTDKDLALCRAEDNYSNCQTWFEVQLVAEESSQWGTLGTFDLSDCDLTEDSKNASFVGSYHYPVSST